MKVRIEIGRARSHWHSRQGLDESSREGVAEVVRATSWPRSLGGIEAYLAVRARRHDLTRGDLDRAVESSEIQVIPAVRGCIYLVPRADVPLLLRIADEQTRKRSDREHEKVGLEAKEIADVGEAIVAALANGALATDALRKALPPGTVRSFGEVGKKIGLSSTLPIALRQLEFDGRVERTLVGGRIDTERYAWRLTRKNPFAGAEVPSESAARQRDLATLFFRAFGPASAKDFATWSALSQREAKIAIEAAGLVPLAVADYADEAFVLEEDLAALKVDVAPSAAISFLPFEDNFVTVHGGPGNLADSAHHGVPVRALGERAGKATTLGEVKHLEARTIFEGDALIGFWEFDPDAGTVVTATFEPSKPKRKKRLLEEAEALAAFITGELGHGRSYSLDSDDALRERAAKLRAMKSIG